MHPKLQQRRKNNTLRCLTNYEQTLIDFASNDYLGFARSQTLFEKMQSKWIHLDKKLGSTGSRLLTGNSRYCENLERQIASFHHAETGLIFSSGFLANLGLIAAIGSEKNTILYDAYIHASMHEAMRLVSADTIAFFHNDLNHLEERLKRRHSSTVFICVESVYSTDGSVAPLKEIAEMASKYEAFLIVDEAHSTGVIGTEGKGLVCHLNLEEKVFARVHTFGKALGVQGAIVIGSKQLHELLINFSSSFIYTTALPYYALAAIEAAYEMLKDSINERLQLEKNIRIFEYNIPNNQTGFPIKTMRISDPKKAKEYSSLLRKQGIDVRPLVSPTVPRGHECLRICLHSFNSEDELDQLFQILEKITCEISL